MSDTPKWLIEAAQRQWAQEKAARENEAKTIALAERQADAQRRLQYAECMLDRCTSPEAEAAWQEVIEDATELLIELEAPDFRDFSNEHPDPPEPSPERQAQIEYWKQRSLDKP